MLLETAVELILREKNTSANFNELKKNLTY